MRGLMTARMDPDIFRIKQIPLFHGVTLLRELTGTDPADGEISFVNMTQ